MKSAVAQTGRSRMKVLTKVAGVAAGILLVAYVVMLPTLREKAKENQDMNLVREVAIACHRFADANDGVMPAAVADLVPYLVTEADLARVELVAIGKLSEIKEPARVPQVISTRISSRGLQAVAFADAHCDLVAASGR